MFDTISSPNSNPTDSNAIPASMRAKILKRLIQGDGANAPAQPSTDNGTEMQQSDTATSLPPTVAAAAGVSKEPTTPNAKVATTQDEANSVTGPNGMNYAPKPASKMQKVAGVIRTIGSIAGPLGLAAGVATHTPGAQDLVNTFVNRGVEQGRLGIEAQREAEAERSGAATREAQAAQTAGIKQATARTAKEPIPFSPEWIQARAAETQAVTPPVRETSASGDVYTRNPFSGETKPVMVPDEANPIPAPIQAAVGSVGAQRAPMTIPGQKPLKEYVKPDPYQDDLAARARRLNLPIDRLPPEEIEGAVKASYPSVVSTDVRGKYSIQAAQIRAQAEVLAADKRLQAYVAQANAGLISKAQLAAVNAEISRHKAYEQELVTGQKTGFLSRLFQGDVAAAQEYEDVRSETAVHEILARTPQAGGANGAGGAGATHKIYRNGTVVGEVINNRAHYYTQGK